MCLSVYVWALHERNRCSVSSMSWCCRLYLLLLHSVHNTTHKIRGSIGHTTACTLCAALYLVSGRICRNVDFCFWKDEVWNLHCLLWW
jgi:hypothetical protein